LPRMRHSVSFTHGRLGNERTAGAFSSLASAQPMCHDDDAHLHDVNADAICGLTRPDCKLLTLYSL